jgi:hypothetical protein
VELSVSKVDIVLLSLPADTADGQLPAGFADAWQQVFFLEGPRPLIRPLSFLFFLFFPRRSDVFFCSCFCFWK